MTDRWGMNMLAPCLIALTACTIGGNEQVPDRSPSRTAGAPTIDRQATGAGAGGSTGRTLPAKYVHAFMCTFAENPIAATKRVHGTAAGRAERAGDLTVLRSLGFRREARDGDLASVGGKITAPPGLTIFGLPVRSLELNGMLGDANALYVTTFADGVAVAQVAKAAGLAMNRASFSKYKIRHYSRRVGNSPYIEAYLDDRGGSNATFSCQVQSTPD